MFKGNSGRSAHTRRHDLRDRRRQCLIDALESRRLLSTTYYVDANSPGPTRNGTSWSTAYTDLQLALAAATSGDTIRVADGTYKPTSTSDRTANFQLKSGVVLLGGYAGQGAANPDARDVTAYPTVLSGDIGAPGNNSDNSYHVVYASGVSASSTLDGFTITGGNANGTGLSASAGGLYVLNSSSPTIRNCQFTGNFAANSGGAIRAESASNPTIINCTFANNSSSDTGGAIASVTSSAPTLTNCTFTGNSAFNGGAVYSNSSSPTFANCTFVGNSAGNRGGAVYHNLGSPSYTDCKFTRNSAANSGGGAFSTGSSPTFTRCTFSGNTSGGDGGALSSIASSSPILVNSILAGNSAINGAAVYNNTSTSTFTNCTLAANVASGAGGAVYNNSGNANLANCIVWANTAPSAPAFFNIGGGSNVTYSDVQGGLAGTGNINADPGFSRTPSKGPDNTWGTADDDYGDLRLSNGSPCVDAGSNASISAGVITDVAGLARVIDFPGVHDPGAVVDMGAHEKQLEILFVDGNATGANNGNSWANAFTNLATALNQAIAGQAIRVADGTYMPTTTADRTISFVLRSGIAVYGGYAGLGAANPDTRDVVAYPTVLSGDIGVAGNNADNSYHVVVGSGTDATAVLDGFTIAGGSSASGVSWPGWVGGGLLNVRGSPTVSNCTFNGNQAGNGGAIYNYDNSSPTLTNCTFSGNTAAGDGGAIYNINNSSPVIIDCTFTGNTATDSGGAVYNEDNSSPTLAICSFGSNAAGVGGAIYNVASSPTIGFCTFSSNSARGSGGAIENNGSSPSIGHCTFSDNAANWGGAIDNWHTSSPAISYCTFSGNAATYLGGSLSNEDGGAIANGDYSAPAITYCSFISNTARSGGAISNILNSAPVISYCIFAGNTASIYGGGAIDNGYSSLVITYCTFTGNITTAYGGGAIHNDHGTAAIRNCTFSGNAADIGGAIYNRSSSTELINSTLAGNEAAQTGGGIYNENCAFIMTNCIVWSNTAPAWSQVFSDSTMSSGVTYSDVQYSYAGIRNLNADPLFYRSPSKGPDGVWGTADDDYGDLRLLPGSPCLDAGSNAAIPAGVTTDLAGNPRTYDFPGAGTAGAATVDMGAYELTQNLGSLRVAAGQTVALPAGGYAFSATQVIVDPGGTLDLADDSLLIDYTGGSPLAAVRSALFAGRNGGAWNGTGIVSSAVRTTANRGVGYAEAADLGLTTFAGQAVDSTALLLKYTVAGDANLDGRINGDDYALTDRGRAKGLGIWVFGDFDYDAAVTGADYTILNAAAAPPPAPAPVMVAPSASEETEDAVPLAVVTAAVEPASAPSQVVAPVKSAVAHAKKPAPAKGKPAKPVPVAKAKAKPKPAPKKTAKPTSVPHAAVIVRKAPPAGKSAHPVSGRSPRGRV